MTHALSAGAAAFGNPAPSSILTNKSDTNAPLVDWQETERFLRLLGRSPESVDPLSAHGILYPQNKKEKAFPFFPLTPAGRRLAERKLASPEFQGFSLGFRVNPGGTKATQITEGVALFAEADGGLSIDAQAAIPGLLGLPEPTFTTWTGGKSLHMYWCAKEGMALSPAEWKKAQKRLIAAIKEVVPEAGVDEGITFPNAVMRAPGGIHPATGERSRIHSEGGERYNLAALAEMLPPPMVVFGPSPFQKRWEQSTGELQNLADLGKATDALAYLPPENFTGYMPWLGVGMALHSVTPALFDAWVSWSKGMGDAFDEEECRAKWETFSVEREEGLGLGSLIRLAKNYGYRSPSHSMDSEDHSLPSSPAVDFFLPSADSPDAAKKEILRWSELISLTLEAIRNGDKDEEMELRAEISGRFRRNDSQVDAALFRLLTEQEAGPKKTASTDSVDLRSVKGLDYLVDGFLSSNGLGLAYGPKGAGKTTAAVAISFSVVDGKGFLDHSKSARQGKVLFIASDSGAGPLLTVLQDMGLGDHPATIPGPDQRFFVWAHDADQGHAAWDVSVNGCVKLLQFVKEEGIDLVVIDSAKAVCAKGSISYMDNDAVNALLTFMKEAITPHTSILFLSHDGTAQGSHAGAKAWAEIVDIVHRQTMKQGEHHSRQWTVVKNRLGPTREFFYSLEEGELVLSQGTETIGDATSAILTVLREALIAKDPKKRLSRKGLHEELMRRFDYAPKTIDNTLQRLVQGKAPRLVRQGKGFYALSPKELYRGCLVGGEEWNISPVPDSVVPTTQALPKGTGVGTGGQSQNRPSLPKGSGVGTGRVMAQNQSPTKEMRDSSPQGGTTPLEGPKVSEMDSVQIYQEGQWNNGWMVERATPTGAGTYFLLFREQNPSQTIYLHQNLVRPCCS